MKPLILAAVSGLTVSAHAQSLTYSIVLSTSGPVANGTTIEGSVRCSWQDPAGIGYAGGSFRLRMEGLSVSDVLIPSNSNGWMTSETTVQRVGVTAAELPPGAGTVSNSWTSGRRPKRAYLADATDPTSLHSGGGFRFPPHGLGASDTHYVAETRSGIVYLFTRNGANVERGIEQSQIPLSLVYEPLFFEPATTLDLFKFQVRAPLHGAGAVTITPEAVIDPNGLVPSISIFTDPGGANHTLTLDQIQGIPASFTYTPAPTPIVAVLALAIFAPRRRR
jgi:hypothetical protein